MICYRCGQPYLDGACGCDDGITLIHGDCREVLPQLPSGSVDLVLTDPPYNVSVKNGDLTNLKLRHSGQAAGLRHFGDWDYDFSPRAVMPTLDAVLSANGSIYVFSSDRLVGAWWGAAESIFRKQQVLSWNKPDPVPFVRQRQWCSATEYVLWAARGRYTFNYLGHADMYQWQVAQAPKQQQERCHPTQKPLSLIAKYIAVSSNPGDLVLDCFAGSGTTGRAAKDLGRRCLMIELEERYVEIAARRLEQQVLPLEQPA